MAPCAMTADEWKAKGNAAVKAGNHKEAIEHYSAGIETGGGEEHLLRSNRALCYQKIGKHEEAAEDAKRCIALKADFVKGYLRAAMSLRALGRPEEALAIVKGSPKDAEVEKLSGELRPEAEAAEQKRIAALGGAERAKEEGNSLFKKGMFEKAIEQYARALEITDDQDGGLALACRNNRAACYHQLSDFSAVVKDTTFVLERDPKNGKALLRRALALEPLEKYEAALADTRAVLLQDPRHEMANKLQHRLSKIVRDEERANCAGA